VWVVDSRVMAVRHFVHVVASSSLSTAPRLFVMRERDKFTLVDQLELMAKRMRGEEEEEANRGGNVAVKIVLGIGHLKLKIPTKYYHGSLGWLKIQMCFLRLQFRHSFISL